MIEQETLDLLWSAIRELPEKYREIFRLSFEEGMKNADIAQLLQISESAVKKRKAQLIVLLRDSLVRRMDCRTLFIPLMLSLLSA